MKRLFYKSLPHFIFEGLERYFRIEVEGAEHIPATGAAILVPNHSGFIGLDALLLSHCVSKAKARVPRIMLHKLWFQGQALEQVAKSLGFIKASFDEGQSVLEKNKL